MIKLIINADDFGYSQRFNRAILELLEKDFIKSTTVMVNRLAKDQDMQVKRLAQLHHMKKISVGLHAELDVWREPSKQLDEQYKQFVKMFGFSPDHIDLHKLTDNKEIVREVARFAERHKLPVSNNGVKAGTKQTTFPAFHCRNHATIVDEATDFLQTAKDGDSCEIVTHPGEYDPSSTPVLNRERELDYKAVIALQDYIKSSGNIENVSYLDL